MIFTVEPMINLGRPHVKLLSDGWTAVTRDRSLSAQFEHTVGVTETGVEIFTLSPDGPLLAALEDRLSAERTPSDGRASRTPAAAAFPRPSRAACAPASASRAPSALADYELLEMALFRAIPRGDTKPLAKALLKRFGSAERGAGGAARAAEGGRGRRRPRRRRVEAIHAFAERTAGEAVRKRPVLSSWSALLDYCRTVMAFEEREQFRILFLDKKNRRRYIR